ncbi:MAG: bifunctional folylpolyglutamate synthase/dihydrofolate synthase [Chthoniobacter sp.]|nr:bifunctional folylpolyglutamate synthase/dihydrofolate synthase [Chthoniobacter sp.]
MTYDEAVAWLYASQLHGIKLGLENIRRLVEALKIDVAGPRAPKFLHVAGTNGKGSVCALLDACCRAGGWRTGLFTSPHLVTFRERIRLDGEMISEADVAEGLTKIRALAADWDHEPTFFEITTALALAWFQGKGAQVVVLETGMGGRLDATNVVTPAVCTLTPIDLDHQQWLGESLPDIAGEKAGILKPGVPAVSAPQADEVRAVFDEVARQQGTEVHYIDAPLEGYELALAGSHQPWNAALAVKTLSLAGLPVSVEAITRGLREVVWPGRFQQIHERFIIDGAHNPAAARRLALTWREVYGEKRASLILGILRDKDVHGICEALMPIAGRIMTVPVQNPRSSTPHEIAKAIGKIAPRHECIAVRDLPAAIRFAKDDARRTLITGSLFLAGEALALFEAQPAPERSAQ